MKKILSPAVLILVVTAIQLSLATRCPAESSIEDVRFGIAGRFKVGFWTRVEVDVKSDEDLTATIEFVCADGDGLPSRFRSQPVELTSNQLQTVELLVRFGRSADRMKVSLVREQGRISKRVRMPSAGGGMTLASQQIVLNLGPDINLSQVEKSRPDGAERSLLTARVESASSLPANWLAYDGVDVVILATGELTAVEGMSDAQLDALDQWVRMGGALVLSAAANAEVLFGEHGRLARFAPGHYVDTVRQLELRGLEDFSGGSQIDSAGSDGADIAIFENVTGAIASFEGFGTEQRPNVIRYAYGFGQVVYLAHDLDRSPLADWSGRARLTARLLGATLDRVSTKEQGGGLGQVSHLGFEDLTGQLRTALDQFSGRQLLPFSLIALVAGIYILLIGPFDFYLLRWFRKRMEWTWITFPLLVAAFCGLAYYMATNLKGTATRINQLDILDFDFASTPTLLRGQTWAHLYSAESRDFDLSLDFCNQRLSAQNCLLYWQGLPGKHFGGMNARAVSDSESRASCVNLVDDGNQNSQLDGFPIQNWSSRSLAGRWWGKPDLSCASALSAKSDELLDGSFENPLKSGITNAWLYYDRWAYRLGKIGPGETIDLARVGHPRNIEWLLTGRKVVDQKHVSTPWQKSSTDVLQIANMMMLHEAALGRSYTGLLNRYQRPVDLSSHLKLGRAVVIGNLDQPITYLRDDGKSMADQYDQRWSFCRFVLPVEHSQE